MENKKKPSGEKMNVSRRRFMKGAALTASAFTVVPRHVLGGKGYRAPSDILNIVGVGVGGMGRSNLHNMVKAGKAQIVGLCDVDWKYSEKTFNDYPEAKKYWDFRLMYEEMKDDFDAVMVATPDHTHAVAAALAMKMGKHAYVQKPLTRTVWESRRLREIANEMGVVTQMGNQGNSGEGIRQVCEWIWDGAIGEVREVHAWTNRPIWPQGLERPTEKVKVPKTLNWELFLGTAPFRPYNKRIHPKGFRQFLDYANGHLGDWGIHWLDQILWWTEEKYPKKICGATGLPLTRWSAPSDPAASICRAARSKRIRARF